MKTGSLYRSPYTDHYTVQTTDGKLKERLFPKGSIFFCVHGQKYPNPNFFMTHEGEVFGCLFMRAFLKECL